MTLNEAIAHAEKVADAGGPCAEDHMQLASWLRELAELRAERDRKEAEYYGYFGITLEDVDDES